MDCACVCWFKGSARLGPVHLHGMLAAFIKWGIEWVKVAQASDLTHLHTIQTLHSCDHKLVA
jgi:hypothetical protein